MDESLPEPDAFPERVDHLIRAARARRLDRAALREIVEHVATERDDAHILALQRELQDHAYALLSVGDDPATDGTYHVLKLKLWHAKVRRCLELLDDPRVQRHLESLVRKEKETY